MKMDDRFAILVYSCIKNSDMWTPFIKLLKKYWPDRKYRIILLSDKAPDRVEGFDAVVAIDGSWYEMIMAGLEVAKTPYVSLWMDDYFLYDHIDNASLDKQLDNAEKYNAGNIRFIESSIVPSRRWRKDKNYNIVKPGTQYSLSTQIGIWNTDFLKKNLRPDRSAWEFERKTSLENADRNHLLLVCRDYDFPYEEVVTKGKWTDNGVRFLRRERIDVDYKRRKAMSSFEMAKLFFFKGILEMAPGFIVICQNCIYDIKDKLKSLVSEEK